MYLVVILQRVRPHFPIAQTLRCQASPQRAPLSVAFLAPKNIFVVGLDDFNFQKLKKIGEAKSYQFHPLLTFDEVKYRAEASPRELLDKAEGRLNSFSGTIDAIVGYWDFPGTCLVPFLNHKYGLPAPTFNSVLKCEHKFWCRVEQSKVLKEHPHFYAFNPFDEDPRAGLWP